MMEEEQPTPAQPRKPHESRPGPKMTLEEKEDLLQRRERAVKFRSMGMSIGDIAKRERVPWTTAHNDITMHLRAMARLSTTIEHRQQIAEIYMRTILRCEKVIQDLQKRDDMEAQEIRFKAIDRIQRAGESLMRVYGLIGPANVVIPTIAATQTGLAFQGIERKDLDMKAVRELRQAFQGFMDQLPRSGVESIEAKFEELPPEEPRNGNANGHPNGESEG